MKPGQVVIYRAEKQHVRRIQEKKPASTRYWFGIWRRIKFVNWSYKTKKDLRYTNYLRSSLSLRYFKGEFLCRVVGGSTRTVIPPSNSPPFLPRIQAGAQLETGAVHKLCSQQILFINRQIPSSARCFRPFQAKQKDLRYTNYLRSSLSLRYFSGEFLCRVAGGSTGRPR